MFTVKLSPTVPMTPPAAAFAIRFYIAQIILYAGAFGFVVWRMVAS